MDGTSNFPKDNDQFEGSLIEYKGKKANLSNEEEVKAILQTIEGNEFKISKVTKKERKRNPAPSFTTSSLQQEAARKLNFRAKKTMMIAQQLYEGIDLGKEGTVGLITYMRTDSTRISETAQEEAKEYILNAYGNDYLAQEKKKKRSKPTHKMLTKQFVLLRQCVNLQM